MDLRDRLARVPEPRVEDPITMAVIDTCRYLRSDEAVRSLERDSYWPKWDSPWWHMLLLHELGEAYRIPERAVSAMVASLAALPLQVFPIRPGDAPQPRLEPFRDSSCHCALGCIHQVLTACRVDVDAALPWIRAWYGRYQMGDGGLNCDETAYLVEDEHPSSMVATIAPFEAMLGAASTAEDEAFLDRAAACLIARELRLGSSTRHNAEERDVAASWLQPCFPRFYFYDVLRGLAALVRWAERGARRLPLAAIVDVVEHLLAAFPDGAVHRQRAGIARCPQTWMVDERGAWCRGPTTSFSLLERVAVPGYPSQALTRQWAETRRGLLRLLDAGLVA